MSGKTVAFTLNGSSVGSASTNGSGVATLSGVSLAGINAGSYPTGVGASFAGDGSFDPSSGSSSLTVSKADQAINVTTHAPATAVYNTSFARRRHRRCARATRSPSRAAAPARTPAQRSR